MLLTPCRDPVAKLDAAEPDPAATLPSGPAAQLTAIFARLPDASSKKAIDDIALDFALLNSKAARKRLVKVRAAFVPFVCSRAFRCVCVCVLLTKELCFLGQTLGSVSRNRQDILPYYGRLVGTLNPYMPDVGKELVALVRSSLKFSWLVRSCEAGG